MGGEGGGVLADWIVDLAEHSGYYAQTTSIPGVAQRTGSTMYYVELFPEAAIRAAGKEPVLALMPAPGELDIVVASELMEAGRAVQRGLVTPGRTTLIASTHRVYSMTEKTAMGDGRVDSQKLLDACAGAARSFVARDFARIAEQTASVISAPLFGALAATGSLPFERAQFEDAIRRSGVGVERSLEAFAAGAEPKSGAGAFACQPVFSPPLADSLPVADSPQPAHSHPLAQRIEREFPPAGHAILLAGVQRLIDYQDYRYASEYLDRLADFRDADSQLLRETGRYLALWMSYEDAIRVADLKTRRARFERVRREARVGPAQVLRIHEFLHPRAAEIADILPAAIGKWLLRANWAKRLVDRLAGHGMVVQTTSLNGYLRLYALAALRRWRRGSLRFQTEHRKMGDWLATVRKLELEDCALAREVAECPRLIKGYGDTHVHGSRSYDALMDALPKLRRMDGAAEKFKQLREAALEDETGRKLEDALRKVTEEVRG
jgi:indolepyruvate ferredoxin oxidoreductase beta subunit